MDNKIELLGFGGLRLPVLNHEIDYEKLNKMVDIFIDAGGKYFDTAHGYMNGKSQIAFRNSLVYRYPRSKYLFADKLSSAFFQTEDDIIPLFEKQLNICGLDYFDSYLMHAQSAKIYEKFKKCNAYKIVEELKLEGRINRIGISIHDKASVLERILTENPIIDFVQIQLNYYDYDSADVDSKGLLEICRKFGKSVVVMEPVKGGRLINIPKEIRKPFDDIKAGSNANMAYRYVLGFSDGHEGLVERILSGVSSISQIEENIKIFSNYTKLSSDENKAIEAVRINLAKAQAIQCTSCKYCLDVCPQQIQIPDLFACYNQNKLFNDWNSNYYYKTVLSKRGGNANSCLQCGKCENICPQHLPIRGYLQNVVSVFEDNKIMKNNNFNNIDINKILVPAECFRMKITNEHIELFRYKRHLPYTPKPGEHRWVMFPVELPFQEGKKYNIKFEIKSTYRMPRTFFLRIGGNTQEFKNGLDKAGEWEVFELDYKCKYAGTAFLVITASDLPAAGNYLWIKHISVTQNAEDNGNEF